MRSIERSPYHFLACCVLHNKCLLRNDEIEELLLDNAEPAHSLLQMETPDYNRGEAEAKRNLICATLFMREM